LEGSDVVAGPFEGHTNEVDSVVSPDGKHIISGALDNTIRVLAGNVIALAGPFKGHTGAYSHPFSLDGESIASGSRDDTIRVGMQRWTMNMTMSMTHLLGSRQILALCGHHQTGYLKMTTIC
jgi:WD40 repeat protein